MEKQYIDVTNIEENPKLFLKIYKASYCVNRKYKDNYQGYDTVKRLTPQQLANQALKDAKRGAAYAQFLVKPENAIMVGMVFLFTANSPFPYREFFQNYYTIERRERIDQFRVFENVSRETFKQIYTKRR